MSISSGERSAPGEKLSSGGLTEADRALLLAMRAWAHECRRAQGTGTEGEHEFILRFWDWLEAGWVRRLCDAWDRQKKAGDGFEPARAVERLREMHIASAAADVAHVHPSWLVRALKDESPAVQRLVAASVPESIRHSIQAGLLLDAQDLVQDHAVDPMFRDWVMGLWTERLLGGESSRSDDSPALLAVCRLSSRAGYRLCRVAGLGKLILAGVNPAKAAGGQARRSRAEWLHGRLSHSDPEFLALARTDVQSIAGSKLPRRRHTARLGLVTLARLLADFEPFRLRWALQHWPYPIVKLTRSLLSGSAHSTATVIAGETELLKTAWERLRLEGRLAQSWREPGGGDIDESRST
jgi:hypothetical protein